MNPQAWGVLAHPPHDWQAFIRWRRVRAYRRHRRDITERALIEWAAALVRS